MAELLVGDRPASSPELLGSLVEINGVPEDNGRDKQVETAGTVHLVFQRAVTQFAEAVKEDGFGKRISQFVFIRVGVRFSVLSTSPDRAAP